MSITELKESERHGLSIAHIELEPGHTILVAEGAYNAPVRVAWDLQAITGPRPTGLGVSVRFLLQALQANEPDVEVVGLRPNEKNQALIGVADRIGWEQWRLPAALRRAHRTEPLSMLYSPALGAPLMSPVPVVAHVHDLIQLHYPQQYTGAAGWYWKKLLPFSWQRCKCLTVSNQTVAHDLLERLGYPAERIHVVPYYADPQTAAAAAKIKPGFADIEMDDAPEQSRFITLATHEPRKNLELAIKAVAWLAERGAQVELSCIGGHSPHTARLQDLARRLNVTERLEFPGYLGREAIVRKMLSCTALLFTSRYEGYGMPPQEAQSVGCAVVLSDIACHRSVYADPERLQSVPEEYRLSPLFIGADDVHGLAMEMQRLMEDLPYRANLRRAGLAYNATFRPEHTAAALKRAFAATAAS